MTNQEIWIFICYIWSLGSVIAIATIITRKDLSKSYWLLETVLIILLSWVLVIAWTVQIIQELRERRKHE